MHVKRCGVASEWTRRTLGTHVAWRYPLARQKKGLAGVGLCSPLTAVWARLSPDNARTCCTMKSQLRVSIRAPPFGAGGRSIFFDRCGPPNSKFRSRYSAVREETCAGAACNSGPATDLCAAQARSSTRPGLYSQRTYGHSPVESPLFWPIVRTPPNLRFAMPLRPPCLTASLPCSPYRLATIQGLDHV